LEKVILSDVLLQQIERGRETLARQIYEVLRRLILTGALEAGTKMPASRSLARETRLSRNTILAAYEQLLAEGYVTSSPRSGLFVSDNVFVQSVEPGVDEDPPPGPAATPGSNLSKRGAHLVKQAGVAATQWGAFVPGVPDVSLFPHAVWAKLAAKRWRSPPADMLTYAHGGGYMPLRRALADYLRLARSVRCEPEQVLITSGIHQSVSVLARLLSDIGDTALMENPGYWGVRSVLASLGVTPVPVDVDDQGLSPSPEQLGASPRFVFVTPSHQYPLGMVMGVARRRMLLAHARQSSAWIIEDDYDSEFRFEGRPLASMQGLDRNDRVLYLGTFSKTVYPGLRMGFMVVPDTLVDPVSSALSELYREGNLQLQAVLADFIEAGHFTKHIRRMRQRYAQRQALLQEAIRSRFGPGWVTSTHSAGLHLVMRLPPGTDDLAISRQASDRGLVARPLSLYYSNNPQPGLLLGYACVAEERIAPSFGRLSGIIEPALNTGGPDGDHAGLASCAQGSPAKCSAR
jgi:GntR family transcriptional regulator/MocR family aminotransferase